MSLGSTQYPLEWSRGLPEEIGVSQSIGNCFLHHPGYRARIREFDLPFGWMDIDVHVLRWDLYEYHSDRVTVPHQHTSITIYYRTGHDTAGNWPPIYEDVQVFL